MRRASPRLAVLVAVVTSQLAAASSGLVGVAISVVAITLLGLAVAVRELPRLDEQQQKWLRVAIVTVGSGLAVLAFLQASDGDRADSL
jgi:multisubunit Na+/H+ antiporter MnhB subunit